MALSRPRIQPSTSVLHYLPPLVRLSWSRLGIPFSHAVARPSRFRCVPFLKWLRVMKVPFLLSLPCTIIPIQELCGILRDSCSCHSSQPRQSLLRYGHERWDRVQASAGGLQPDRDGHSIANTPTTTTTTSPPSSLQRVHLSIHIDPQNRSHLIFIPVFNLNATMWEFDMREGTHPIRSVPSTLSDHGRPSSANMAHLEMRASAVAHSQGTLLLVVRRS